MLFSATQTKKIEALTTLALKKEPIYIGVHDKTDMATVSGLEQGYIICPSEKRMLVLFTFLKKNRKKKVMVFFSSCMSVKYHHELFNYIDLPVMCIHVSSIDYLKIFSAKFFMIILIYINVFKCYLFHFINCYIFALFCVVKFCKCMHEYIWSNFQLEVGITGYQYSPHNVVKLC